MKMEFRRCLENAALATALLLALPAAASADMSLTVGKAAPTSDAIIPVNVGDQLGIFKKHGLDLKIIEFGGGSKAAQALTAGAIDIEDGAGSEMAFVAKGAPMIGVCESTAPAPFLAVGVPPDSPIKSLQDLKGKLIGVSNPGSFSDWSAHLLAKKNGWGDDGVKTVGLGNGAGPVGAAFKAHQVDAFVTNTTLILAMAEKNEARLIAPVSTYEGNVASGVLYASNQVLAKNPEAIRAFIAAWIETVDWMHAHKAETVKIESGITKFDEAVMAQEYDLVIGMYTKDCRFDAESMAALKQSFIDLKLVDGVPDMAKLYTEAYLPK
ncbi:MAG TPA: ABC transporter substrate-binding protein [Stellaceae bacterium]|nr:ABC transporter substrate-binding protein [Stellaceae bacterium]